MINLTKMDRITNVICKPSPSFSVKHIINLKRDRINNSSNINFPEKTTTSFAFNYSIKKNNKEDYLNKGEGQQEYFTGLYFDFSYFLKFEGYKIIERNENGNEKKQISSYIYPRELPSVMNMLEVALEWFKNTDEIFLKNETSIPFKIKNPSLCYGVPLSQSTYIKIKPCILEDNNHIKYEAIAMGGEKGEIANFTSSEFFIFYASMKSFYNNIYNSSINLLNCAINYATHENMIELLNKGR